MKRIWKDKIYIIKLSWQVFSGVLVILEFLGLSIRDFRLPKCIQWKSAQNGIVRLLFLWLIIILVCSFYCKLKNKIKILKSVGNHNVYLQYGDVFSDRIVQKQRNQESSAKRNLVIPVNCCFDTIVDDDLVSSRKIHGIAFNKLYDSGKYTQETLNEKIQEKLKDSDIKPKTLTRDEKRKGNLQRFPFGTVVEIEASNSVNYFLVALTKFNSDLHVEIDKGEYLTTIQRMIDYISSRSQGIPTVMPIMGGGLPEISDSEQSILELMVKIIKFNKDKINCDYHIVIRESGKNDITIFGI